MSQLEAQPHATEGKDLRDLTTKISRRLFLYSSLTTTGGIASSLYRQRYGYPEFQDRYNPMMSAVGSAIGGICGYGLGRIFRPGMHYVTTFIGAFVVEDVAITKRETVKFAEGEQRTGISS